MAITRLADVFPAHKSRSYLIALALEAAVLTTLTIILVASGVDLTTMIVFFLLPAAVMQIFAFVVVLGYALEPLDFLSRGITHVSKQANNVTPPNLNGTRHEKTGFKLMVETIYDLAVKGPGDITPSGSALQSRLLDSMPVGVIALNVAREVIFTNAQAPVVKADAGTSVELLFDENDGLEQWLSESEKTQVSASRTWSRVQNKIPGSEGRRVFDVVANYQKSGAEGVETVLITVDQTGKYAANEDGMDFIALAAHELRGPVTVIRGYLDVLSNELQLGPQQKELFERLEVSANRLSSYIGNILNASKYDRRHLKLHLREERLADIYTLVADDLMQRARTQGRVLSVTIPGGLPTVAADRGSLNEVLVNFVDNGIKYSREGGHVQVDAAVDGDFVQVRVTDQGIGIPTAVVGNLFNKFYRSHRSRQTVAGTGLGLYISKAIIESHGGHVGVKSTEGEGSTFTFSVPIYSTVKDKLLASDNENQGIIESSSGWIKNHSMYKG